jgi:hypothetical protein
MNNDLIKAYTDTDYHILPLEEIVKIGQRNPRLDEEMISNNWSSYVIITAWNPRSIEVDYEENLIQNLKLLQDIVEMDLYVYPAVGKSKDNYWKPEESWCVFNIGLEKGQSLGQKYNQNAIVFGKLNEEATLVHCF